MTPLKFLGQQGGRLPRIDRYELIAEIASGGMASVYLARLVGVGGFERFFAVKRLHPHLSNEMGFVTMFLDEARIVAGIRHQHVVPVLEVGASEHGYYLVMEYIEGDTLGSFLSRSITDGAEIPVSVTVRIMLDTLAGLHAAHEHVDPNGLPIGLVHRDVSPQNILVDTNGVARIADFGVAHATSRLSSTQAGQLKGKVAYMAPEQARGEVVTPRSDVFAAGIVLWEALCRRRLFLADNEAITLNNLIFEPIPSVRRIDPSLPASIDAVLIRALDRDPARRFSSAAEMAEALQDAARRNQILGTPAGVRAFVHSVLGRTIELRRASVREHLAKMSEGEGPAPALDKPDFALVKPSDSSVSSAAMALPPHGVNEITAPATVPPPAGGKSRALILAAAAMLLGASAMGAAFLAFRGDPVSQQPQLGSSPVTERSPDPPADKSVAATNTASEKSAPDPVPCATPSATAAPKKTRANPTAPPPPASTTAETSPPDPPDPVPTTIVAPADTGLEKNPYR